MGGTRVDHGTDAARLPGVDPKIPHEELRFGVVLNGGVSLAVWMGGVAKELDDVTRARRLTGPDDPPVHDTRSIYALLLDLVRCRARADVIAGTSAGGINGAALALSQLNENADIGSLRDIWADQGRMESLLREPFQGSPASLLKGDEYFYPAMERALESLARGWQPVVEAPWSDSLDRVQRPVDLTITTTLLHGARQVSVDSLGQRIPDRVHEATFMFRKSPAVWGTDHFADPNRGTTLRALALAARCSAGFPVAFEPSFVPVNVPPATPDLGRPDMAEYASWADPGVSAPGEQPAADASRFAVDGGLLANTPTRHVLRAIQDMPASDPVRRVVLLVHPHAPIDAPVPADRADAPPKLTSALTGLLGALQSQGQRAYVADLDQHNSGASGRRATRTDILRTINPARPSELRDLARGLYPHFRMLCARRAAREVADSLADAQWSAARIQRQAPPPVPDATMDLLPEPGPDVITEADTIAVADVWGLDAAIGIADAATDYLRRLAWLVKDEAAAVLAARSTVIDARAFLVALRAGHEPATTASPSDPAAARDTSEGTVRSAVDEFQRNVMGTGSLAASASGSGGAQPIVVARLLAMVGEAVVGTESAFEAVMASPVSDRALSQWRFLVGGRLTGATCLNRLYQLHVATSCLADESVTESVNPFEVVQISLQARNPFTVVTRSGDDKLAGMALNRFGGFLKRSWRLNDWAWGRLDAATMLTRVILDPQRMRRVAVLSGPDDPLGAVSPGPDADGRARQRAASLVTRLVGECFTAGSLADPGVCAAVRHAEREAGVELFRVFLPVDVEVDLPPSVPALADLAAWALHLRIITEELPHLASAIKVDAVEGANTRSNGQILLAQHQELLAAITALPPRIAADDPATHERRLDLGIPALRAFDRAGIGREPLAREGASDQIIRTTTTAASVAVTVLDSDRSGLGIIKPVTRTLRGGMLLPYWISTGLTSGGGIARLLALGALALGGVLLALALLSVIGSWGAVLGGGIALFGLGYAALRSGNLLHGLVLLAPVAPLAVVGFELRRDAAAGANPANTQIVMLAAIGLVLGLIVIGSLPSEIRSPAAFARERLRALARWTRAVLSRLSAVKHVPAWLVQQWRWVLLGVVVIAAVVAAVVFRSSWVDALPGWLRSAAGGPGFWFTLVLVLGVVVGAWRANRAGTDLRMYSRQHRPGDPGDAAVAPWRDSPVVHEAGTAAGWSVVYGAITGVLAIVLWSVNAAAPGVLALGWFFAGAALVLVLVVPVWVPARYWRRLGRNLAPRGAPLETRTGDVQQQGALLDVLVRRGLLYAKLVEPVPGHQQVLRLTPYGLRVAAGVEAPADFVVLPQTPVLAQVPNSDPARRVPRGPAIAVYPETRRPESQPVGPPGE